jgi:hypothetical protein
VNPGATFEGFQSETRTIQALPVRIDYQSPRSEHFLRQRGSDWLLCSSAFEGRQNSAKTRQTTNLNPYAVRNEFETIEDEKEAVRFMSESGRFWPFHNVLWSQFQEWQAFFRWLRTEPVEAMKDSEGKKAWDTAAGLGNSFFTLSDAEFSRSRFPVDVIEDYGATGWREIEIQDREQLFCLRRFALHPERPREGNRVSLDWYDPSNEHPPEDWKARIKGKKKGAVWELYLHVEALNVVEAIAATIFADRANGTRFGKCKHCGKLFKIESGHGQTFCPAPAHLQTSPCKNAHLQFERRRNEKDAIEFLLEAWRDGMKKNKLKSEAAAQGIRITAQAEARAKRKFKEN